MESISLIDGLVLTVISMLLVFLVLGAIGLLINLISKWLGESPSESIETDRLLPANTEVVTDSLAVNEEYQFVAEMMALVLASEDEPGRKFEVVESKRIH